MNHPKLRNLYPEEIETEYQKCQNSISYFYNNYCRKEGQPEYTEEEFEKYINTVKLMKNGSIIRDRRMKLHLLQYPLTIKDAFKK